MTRIELAEIVGVKTGMNTAAADRVIVAALNTIKEQVCDGENVYLRGFGTVLRRLRAPKIGQDITAGRAISIPARFVPGIKFSPSFIDRMPKVK